MSRNAIAQILLAASISFTACGGGSKSSDSTTTPSAQNEQAPVPGEAVPSQGTAGATPTESAPTAVGDPSTGAMPSGERQPVSGTTTDSSGMGTPGSTTGTTPGTTGTPGTPDMSGTPPSTTGTPDSSGTVSGAGTGTTPDTSGTSDTAGAIGGALTEPAIFAALSAANQHEIEVSQLALEKSKNKEVKKFAKLMVGHHTKLQAEGDKTAQKLSITPEDNADVKALKDDSRTAVEKLRGLEGKEFDRAWATQMVQDHEKVLTLIDNQILPAASSNDQIQTLVKGARPKIESHLAQARKLETKLGGAAM